MGSSPIGLIGFLHISCRRFTPGVQRGLDHRKGRSVLEWLAGIVAITVSPSELKGDCDER